MKHYNFDKVIKRKNTNAVKIEKLKTYFGRTDLIPLWVADMDFETPDFIRKAIRKRLKHPIYGYSTAPDSYWDAIINWEYKLHGWRVSREELTYIPGIVKGIGLAVLCFTDPGDKVVIQPPVYHPFRIVPTELGREVVYNPLVMKDGRYSMDFDQLDTLCAEEKPKMLVLSNPHNPGGVVWSRETLEHLAKVCKKHGVIVISDEIHADMVFAGCAHTPFAKASDIAAEISITFGAPSKTFNIPGLVSSFAVVKNPALRDVFFGFLKAAELDDPTFIATVATEAAYTKGAEWREQMLSYVNANIDYVENFIANYIPEMTIVRPQASFLVWIDCRGMCIPQDELVDLFVRKAKLALNDGSMFGEEGEGFMRLNVAVPRSVLEKAMSQLSKAVSKM